MTCTLSRFERLDSLLQLTKYWDGYVISRIDKIVAVCEHDKHMYDSDSMTTNFGVISRGSDIMSTQHIGWNSLQQCTCKYWNEVETCRT
jgi:hypothetical protein